MKKIISGHVLLFRFYLHEGMPLLREMAKTFNRLDAKNGRYLFSRKIADRYNARYEELRWQLKSLHGGGSRFVPTLLVPVFAIRILCVLAAAFSSIAGVFGGLLLQLIVAPYSLFAGVAAWGLVVPAYVVHYLQFGILQIATSILFFCFPSLSPYCHVVVGWPLILLCFLVDQVQCLCFCLFWTPIGKPIEYPVRRIVQSMWYGFLNCKTYWLVLLLCLRGTELDLLAIVAFALTPVKLRSYVVTFAKRLLPYPSLHWTWSSSMFYHYHRMVHLPAVYNQSHRPHHFLHDSTPFDANLYGSGLPEEWLKLATEISLAVFVGLVPHSFSPATIRASIVNRIGHTRLRDKHPPGGNFHVDHHSHYQKNFGIVFPPLDLILGTEHGDVSFVWTETIRFICTKTVEPGAYVLHLRPWTPAKPAD
jgi:sterol desaturase/sphingolipid hydroxylase (fatty acid hydroxylase superfamily)